MATVSVFSQDMPDTTKPHRCSLCSESSERVRYTRRMYVGTFPSPPSTLTRRDIHPDGSTKWQGAHPVSPSQKRHAKAQEKNGAQSFRNALRSP
jgi:hypothetical protein